MVENIALPRVVLEPTIEAHDPALYEGVVDNHGVSGFDSFCDADLARYRERGYLVVRRGFAEKAVQGARDELDRMARSDEPRCRVVHYEGAIMEHLDLPDEKAPGVSERHIGQVFDGLPVVDPELRARYVRKFLGFCSDHALLDALAHDVGLLGALERILEEPPQLFQDMALVKPPGGREKPWHQDHAYFNYPLETRIVGVWIALDEVDVENGCMVVLPGGHLEGPRIHFMRRDYQICDTDIEGESRVALPMGPGDVLLFDGKIPHGTPTNRTRTQRWAVQYHYAGETRRPGDEVDYREEFGSEGKDVSC